MPTFIKLHYTSTDPEVRINFDQVKTYIPCEGGEGTIIQFSDGSFSVAVVESANEIDKKIQQARILDVYNYPSQT